ncbi:lovastatin diketide synthase LovF, partial [Rhypophila decipiens]
QEPLAVVGMAFRLPRGAVDDISFWEAMAARKNAMTAWPDDRLGLKEGDQKIGKLNVSGGHFIQEDLAVFDAPFFSITAKEAIAMDPQQRWALEVSYHAFENAGMPVESLRGTKTAVFATTFSDDYTHLSVMDPHDAPPQAATGNSRSIFANRISWNFDLRGPSVFVDTACSSSVTALDLACQTIRNGDASSALVVASNMMLSPEFSLAISKLGIISPSGRCWSFDARGDGYARGEGVIALVVKPLSAALRDGDTIRAVVRATGTNQDGRTPIMMQPSAAAQEELIRRVYAKAGLGLEDTRYFEAHGTGTPTGDPIEMSAIGSVFQSHRSRNEPLYVGSVKANIGHLEGASGLAGLVKSILSLEKGVIPPNALFETLNPAIDADGMNVRVPVECIPWPCQGLRRISVNSFGFGGSNAHVILDDALHYLQSQGLTGYHLVTNSTLKSPTNGITNGTNGTNATNGTYNGNNSCSHSIGPSKSGTPRLLVWSAADSNALRRMVTSYQDYFHANVAGQEEKLSRLAYTLAARRSAMSWRTFAVVDDSFDTTYNDQEPFTRTSVSTEGHDGMVFVFTGQGAHYAGMGLLLAEHYPVVRESLETSDKILSSLGCKWSVFDRLNDAKLINRAESSQPLCTVLQIALVQLLRDVLGIVPPAAVVGHSSGEIAAAYCAGALSHEAAVKVAYFRGVVAQKLIDASEAKGIPGAMLAVNLAPDRVPEYLEVFGEDGGGVEIACFNSQSIVTLSGPLKTITALKQMFDEQGIFARVINTGIAYHSSAMRSVVAEYRALLGSLEDDQNHASKAKTIMVSSVTGTQIASKLLSTPQYWIDNLVSPVRFFQAVTALLSAATSKDPDAASITLLPPGVDNLTDLVEIGPHSALKWPLTDTLDALTPSGSSKLRYHSVLERKSNPLNTVLSLLGKLFCLGHINPAVSITTGNRQTKGQIQALSDLPPYPFDHTRRYWTESRMSKDIFSRLALPPGETYMLGRRSQDWNPLRPKWKKWLCVETMPWLADHVVNGATICPATGMLVMAVEAILEYSGYNQRKLTLDGILIKTAAFLAPIVVGQSRHDSTEVELHLTPVSVSAASSFEVSICAYYGGRWAECFRAEVQLEHGGVTNEVDGGRERRLQHEQIRQHVDEVTEVSATRPISTSAFYDFVERKGGIKYGESFQQLSDLGWDGDNQSAACIELVSGAGDGSPVHPAVLDAAVHLGIAQLSKGLTEEAIPTLVPQRLANMWLFPSPWAGETSKLKLGTALHRGEERGASGSLRVTSEQGKPLCWIEKLVWSEVSKAADSMVLDENDIEKDEDMRSKNTLLYSIEWLPQLSSLTGHQLQSICDEVGRPEAQGISWRQMENAMRLAVRKVLDTISDKVLGSQPPEHMVKYLAYMRKHYSCLSNDFHGCIDEEEIEALLTECATKQPAWRIFPAIVRALPSILRGEVDALQLLFPSGGESDSESAAAVKDFYWWVFDAHMADGRFRKFLDLATHEKPAMRILEIGAGTGGLTRHVLSQLRDFEQTTGQSRFAEYVYTDVSGVFFEAAMGGVAGEDWCRKRMTFRTLDMDRDPTGQGFELGSFDMVLAASVLHVTSDIEASLGRVRSLLKPGGKLVAAETIKPDSPCVNVAFGPLAGWWTSTEDWRKEQGSPLATEKRWEEMMLSTGFSGFDLLLRDDGEDDESRFSSIMVTTATAHQPADGTSQAMILLVNSDADSRDIQHAAAAEIMRRCPSWNAKILSLADYCTATSIAANNSIVISLVEVGGSSHLASLSKTGFEQLKQMILSSKEMMWVASSDEEMTLPSDPHKALGPGLLRSVRNEDDSKHLVSLLMVHDQSAKHGNMSSAADAAGLVTKVLESCFVGEPRSPEVEFIGHPRSQQLCIGRVRQDRLLDKERVARSKPQLQLEEWNSRGRPVILEIGTPGKLDTIRWAEDIDVLQQQDLEADHVEVKILACPLGPEDVALAGQKTTGMGPVCAGIVTRTGIGAGSQDNNGLEEIQPGDSVIMIPKNGGCMRSHARVPTDRVFKTPSGIPLREAVAMLAPGATSYHSLVNIARLQEGESVLVHSAASIVGQMMVAVAQMICGASQIFVTVSSEQAKALLQAVSEQHFNSKIPDDHIFFSGDSSFVRGILRQTYGKGVDVVINNINSEQRPAISRSSWECLAPYGRFVDIIASKGLDKTLSEGMHSALGSLKNLTYAAVDLQHIIKNNPKLTKQLVQTILDLVAQGRLPLLPSLHQVYPVSDTEEALRHLQQQHKPSGAMTKSHNTAPILISMENGQDLVPKFLRLTSTWSFDPNASYLVAGGLGSIGRALLSWMVSRGAKHLIVPSRSGGQGSKAATDLVSRLTNKQDVTICAPKCDISSRHELASMLEDCSKTMPPIKGCINAAMVLQDAIFENMSYSQWSTTVRSKVDATWNLHSLLPKTTKFFILLSSLSGIQGTMGQANYVAGCAFQDAIAQARTSAGYRNSISLDLGWVRPTGDMAVHNASDILKVVPIEMEDLIAVLEHCCDPARAQTRSQILVGVTVHGHFVAKGMTPPAMLDTPLFSGFENVRFNTASKSGALSEHDGQPRRKNFGVLFRLAGGDNEREGITVAALQDKLADGLGVNPEDVDERKTLSEYGVDSLMAVELRNWMRKDFGASVAVFDMMNAGRSIKGVAGLVV